MLSIHNKNQRNSLEIERQTELAITALKNKKIIFIHKVAQLYDVLNSILIYQLSSCSSCMILHANSHQLTDSEEKTLIQ